MGWAMVFDVHGDEALFSPSEVLRMRQCIVRPRFVYLEDDILTQPILLLLIKIAVILSSCGVVLLYAAQAGLSQELF